MSNWPQGAASAHQDMTTQWPAIRCIGKVAVPLLVISVMSAWAPSLEGEQTPFQKGLPKLLAVVDSRLQELEPKIVEWQRMIHQDPELAFQEIHTAALVTEHLRRLGLEVSTGIAQTGVVGLLRGGRPGKTIALRAEMDALQIGEAWSAESAPGEPRSASDQMVVAHVCGHDAHTAILMGVAAALTGIRDRLAGNVVFIFQPGEEGAGGARRMLVEGLLESFHPDAIVAMHASTMAEAGVLGVGMGPLLAGADRLTIIVNGRQTHAALPWQGVDPIVVASHIVIALQTIVSRELELPRGPALVSFGRISGGTRRNVLPAQVILEGTIRTMDNETREAMHAGIRRVAESIASANRAEAIVQIVEGLPPTVNEPQLASKMAEVLRDVVGEENVLEVRPKTVSDDFALFAQKIPGFYFLFGVNPPGTNPTKAAPNHSPEFVLDERALPVASRALAHVALSFLDIKRSATSR